MRPRTLILAFAPLIVFSVLTRILPSGLIGAAALAAAVIVLIAELTSRPGWPPKLLSTCLLALLGPIAVLGFTVGQGGDAWLAIWGGAGIGLAVGLLILALIPVMPFTEQFARETTPRAYWSSPTFRQVNRVLSAGWGVAIFLVGVCRVIAAAISQSTSRRLPELLLGLVIPVAIILAALKFSHCCYRSLQ
ncbi:MAG TPA: hypothetical protein VGH27_29305 [Streptosporangiaceae bacterium]|jgi:hypothetical protein